MSQTKTVENFGRNVRFQPAHVFQPNDETELLSLLNKHRTGRIRVVASTHAWSPLIATDDSLLDLSRFNHVETFEADGQTFVRAGAGCQVKRLLAILNRKGLTLPSIGLITEQRIAGAISTGTHGSGKHSLSHYVTAVRIACFPAESDRAEIRQIDSGPELEAARCSLGCLGVIVEVTLPCVPQYLVREQARPYDTIEEVLQRESDSPLQQFFMLPHNWKFYASERSVSQRNRRSAFAWLYQIYWFTCIDVGMHVAIKLFAGVCRSRFLVRLLFHRLLPCFIFPWWVVVDRSDRVLTMEHELFRHLELEAFIPRPHIAEASRYVAEVLKHADGAHADGAVAEFTSDPTESLRSAGLLPELDALQGTYTHHYPVAFRKILRDDTMISMASGTQEAWYSISFITYVEPRDRFYRLATFLARSLHVLYGGRIHWGKWFPLNASEVEAMYPRLREFRTVCSRFDPDGVFRNQFVQEHLFATAAETVAAAESER